MSEALWLIAATFFAVAGMGWLALSLSHHWQQVFPNAGDAHILRLRSAGWGFLVLSALSCFQADHPSMAVLVWVMLIPLSAIMIAMMLIWCPRLLRVICPGFITGNR